MSSPIKYSQAKFLISVANLNQLPPEEGGEVAFVGRSNAGKSSALNVLTRQKGLARTSKTPGRTQLLNFFEIDEHRRLVDLPGYGYAKVPHLMKEKWQRLVTSYLETRACLRGLILLMDIRHPFKEFDQAILEWATNFQIPTHILLTKADKLSRSVAAQTLRSVEKAIVDEPMVSVQLFSALSHLGVDDLEYQLNHWLKEV